VFYTITQLLGWHMAVTVTSAGFIYFVSGWSGEIYLPVFSNAKVVVASPFSAYEIGAPNAPGATTVQVTMKSDYFEQPLNLIHLSVREMSPAQNPLRGDPKYVFSVSLNLEGELEKFYCKLPVWLRFVEPPRLELAQYRIPIQPMKPLSEWAQFGFQARISTVPFHAVSYLESQQRATSFTHPILDWVVLWRRYGPPVVADPGSAIWAWFHIYGKMIGGWLGILDWWGVW